MGLGILEPKRNVHVPGTVLLDQQAAHSENQTGNLKHDTGKNAHIVLSPQPSEDPNDPLNWSPFKKNLVLSVIFLGVIVHGAVPGPILNAGIVPIALELHKSFTQVAKLGGYLLLTTGAMGPFASAFGRKYGKRPLYVFSSICGTIGIIVSETASGYNQLLAGRIIQGLGVAAYESLAIASVGDIFFVHQRGPRIAVVIFLLAAISNGVAIIAGVITANLGWHYNFHIYLPFAVIQTIMVILYCPETMYRRDSIFETDQGGSEVDLRKLASHEAHVAEHIEKSEAQIRDPEKAASTTVRVTANSIPRKKTYVQNLALYNGVFVDDPVWKMFLGSIAIMFNLGPLYQIILTGLLIAWYVCIAITTGVIFGSPPYLMSASSIGYMSTGPLVGGIIGGLFSFLASAPFIKYMTRRNKGIYEPEFCLIPCSLGCVCTVAGLVGWGYAVQNVSSVYLVCFLWGLMLFGITVLASFATQWALDAFRQHSTEVFVMNMVFKNFFFYGLTNYVINWYLVQGAVNMTGTMAGITAFLCLLAIPMYVYGKRHRLWLHHHNALTRLHLETDHAGAE